MLDIQLHCRPVRKDVLLMPNPACCWFGSLQATLFFFFWSAWHMQLLPVAAGPALGETTH